MVTAYGQLDRHPVGVVSQIASPHNMFIRVGVNLHCGHPNLGGQRRPAHVRSRRAEGIAVRATVRSGESCSLAFGRRTRDVRDRK